MAESKEEKEGQTETRSLAQVKASICHAFGDADGKALIAKIEQNPLSFLNDQRGIVVEYANLLKKPMNSNPLIAQLVKQVNDLKARLDALECGFNETSINVTLGQIRYAPKLEFKVPNQIPDSAKKILVLLSFESGSSTHDILPNLTMSATARDAKSISTI